MSAGTEREELRALIREAHEAITDLRREVREAKAAIGEMADGAIEAEVAAQLKVLGDKTRQAMDESVAKVGKEFGRLEVIFLGKDSRSRREGRPPIEDLLRRAAGDGS